MSKQTIESKREGDTESKREGDTESKKVIETERKVILPKHIFETPVCVRVVLSLLVKADDQQSAGDQV